MTSTYATKAYVDERLAPLEERVRDMAKQLEGHGFMMNRVLTDVSTIKDYLEEVLKRHGDLTRAVKRQGALLEQHTVRLDGIDGRLDAVDRRFDGIDGRLDAMDARFDAIDGRLDAVDRRFDAIDGRLDAVDRRFDAIDGRLDAVDRRFDAIEGRLDAMDGRLDTMDGRLGRLEAGQVRTGVLLERVLERLPPPPALPVN